MTPTEAAALHAKECVDDAYVMWFITRSDPTHLGRVVAYAKKPTRCGGERLPGELIADSLDELRAMLPAGLTRHDRSQFDLPETVEVWD